MSFGGNKLPAAPPPPAPIEPDQAEVTQAAEEERRRLQAARGRSANVITSGRGVQGPAPSARVELLGY